jgi:riboflavin kinase/FMN adenylyltransferase
MVPFDHADCWAYLATQAKVLELQIMQQWNSSSSVTTAAAGSAVTIGKYDAIHVGHQEIFAQLVSIARTKDLTSVVLTFDGHPNAVLDPTHVPFPILGPKLRAEYIAATGVDATLTLDFNSALAEMPARDFVELYLVKTLRAKVVIVGEGFKFGAHGSGTCDTLRELAGEFGFEVIEVPCKRMNGEIVSTTAVRQALERGDVASAADLLGRRHLTRGVIEHGLKIGRTIGFPTANMERGAEGYLPLDGVYGGWLIDGVNRYPAAISIGINETFQTVPRLAEAFVLDRNDLDLYDHIVDFEYVGFVRPTEKFNGADELISAIHRDIEKVRLILR